MKISIIPLFTLCIFFSLPAAIESKQPANPTETEVTALIAKLQIDQAGDKAEELPTIRHQDPAFLVHHISALLSQEGMTEAAVAKALRTAHIDLEARSRMGDYEHTGYYFTNYRGWTALHIATYFESVPTMRVLLAAGASAKSLIYNPDPLKVKEFLALTDITPLCLAAWCKCSPEIMLMLLLADGCPDPKAPVESTFGAGKHCQFCDQLDYGIWELRNATAIATKKGCLPNLDIALKAKARIEEARRKA